MSLFIHTIYSSKGGSDMDWNQLVAPAVGSALMALGGLISWIIKTRLEQLRTATKDLQTERRKIYVDLLIPYIRLVTALPRASSSDQVPPEILEEMLSYEYRKTAFEVILLGSDEVVRSFNSFMGQAYKSEVEGADPIGMIHHWGNLLLEIRKSLGNKKTDLDSWEMMRWMITDIDKYIDNKGRPRTR